MRRFLYAAVVGLAALPAWAADQAKPNTLTPKEIADGWILLFDGETPFGWKIDGEARVADGSLILGGKKATRARLTTEFGMCECRLEFRYEGQPASLRWSDAASVQHFPDPLEKKPGWGRFALTVREQQTDFLLRSASNLGTTVTNAYYGYRGGLFSPRGKNKVFPTYLALAVPPGSKLLIRNVKLKPTGLKPLFNGKDLAGWKEIKGQRYKSRFTVTDQRELNIKDGPGDIQTEGQWADFILQLECISHGKHLNSGVFFRCLPGQFWSGYEAQIRNQWQDDDRTRPIDYGTGGIYNRQPARKVVSSDHEWFTMTVAAAGTHLAVWVNGYQTADFTDLRKPDRSARKGSKVDRGPISLQGHDKTTNLSFRNIRIAELASATETRKKEQK